MSEFLSRFAGPLAPEIAGEVATALGLSGRRLQDKLRLLQNYDEDPAAHRHHDRDWLVADAAEALWGYVVQREILGLHDADYVMQAYGVTSEVRMRMGPARRPGKGLP